MNKLVLKMLILLTASVAFCQVTTRADGVAAKADIKFRGSSTLHDFEGTVSSKPFIARFQEDPETGKLKVSAKATLSVEGMTTNNKKRDKKMYKMFDLEHFKNIEGELSDTWLSEDGHSKATLHLRIRDVERDVIATLSNVQRHGQQVSCTMTFPVSLSAFGLKAPSVMGIIQVDDTVHVECRIVGHVVNKVDEK